MPLCWEPVFAAAGPHLACPDRGAHGVGQVTCLVSVLSACIVDIRSLQDALSFHEHEKWPSEYNSSSLGLRGPGLLHILLPLPNVAAMPFSNHTLEMRDGC